MIAESPTPSDIRLPVQLQQQLQDYRRSVWISKTSEAIAIAVFFVFAAFLSVFAIDRFLDTSPGVRFAALLLAGLGCLAIPWACYRWIWQRRSLPQVARLISRQMPGAGDRLLGVLDLVEDPVEQRRSPELCFAAVQQVASEATQWDLIEGAQPPRRKSWSIYALALTAVTVALAVFVPAASSNSWARLLRPWADISRYSFAALAQVPPSMVVPHGESFTLELAIADDSLWKPASGKVTVGNQQSIETSFNDGTYRFEVPGQIDETSIAVRIGDARHEIQLLPTLRPELTSVMAHLKLPEYLRRPSELEQDVRGGSLSLVSGSRASIHATADRELDSARVNGKSVSPQGKGIRSSEILVEDSSEMQFQWTDQWGLGGKQPFKVSITRIDDAAPNVSCRGLLNQQVVLVSEQLRFEIQAHDDFGVREVGIEWEGASLDGSPAQLHGERPLAAGGAEREVMHVSGTFTAESLGIEPQPIFLRMYAEDYLPGRDRSYSQSYLLYVLTPDQHAIWLTEQLSKWHRRALEVRDRELQLYETNKQIRALSPETLELSETRKRIERQAAAERANGRRLSSLNHVGEQLVQQAMRNPEFGVGHLEKWAEMLQLLKEISANRMPSVADLLKDASNAPKLAANSASRPTAGVDRSSSSNVARTESKEGNSKQPAVPQIVDRESSQQPQEDLADDAEPQKKSASTPKFTLPVTTLAGKAGKPKPSSPTEEKMEEAVTEQRDLLAEFERIANELNNILANLEGSTLVKRLKAASRKQYATAGKIGELIDSTFGFTGPLPGEKESTLISLSKEESADSLTVSYIMDDMQAYFQRRPFARFRTVLEEMNEADVVGNLRDLGEQIPEEQGLSMAQCEYWSDSLDRWAEDLVDPACSGSCPGCKSRGFLPPSIVLEAMKILEEEIELREETRVAEQAKPAVTEENFTQQATQLSETQDSLRGRTEDLVKRIRALPEGESLFGKEIQLLSTVAVVMEDARSILSEPNTGSEAIAAETEAIELLLQSKRINPRGGGGGGASPGGGGGGDTTDSALALLGKGVNEKEVRVERDVHHATGSSKISLPEEFRAGLDEYFNRIVDPNG